MELNTIQNKSNWGKATESINTNFAHVGSEIDKLKYAAYNSKLYPSLEVLQQEKPNPSVGDWAIVGDTIPGAIYRCSTEGVWSATGEIGGGYGMNVTETNVTENNHYGDIINNPDNEDLFLEKDENTQKEVMKFANKAYDTALFSGLGRVYLRKNIVNSKNALTQEMMSTPYTRYIVQYDYDLNGEKIVLPEHCILCFEGGSVKNGTIEISSFCKVFNIQSTDCSLYLGGSGRHCDIIINGGQIKMTNTNSENTQYAIYSDNEPGSATAYTQDIYISNLDIIGPDNTYQKSDRSKENIALKFSNSWAISVINTSIKTVGTCVELELVNNITFTGCSLRWASLGLNINGGYSVTFVNSDFETHYKNIIMKNTSSSVVFSQCYIEAHTAGRGVDIYNGHIEFNSCFINAIFFAIYGDCSLSMTKNLMVGYQSITNKTWNVITILEDCVVDLTLIANRSPQTFYFISIYPMYGRLMRWDGSAWRFPTTDGKILISQNNLFDSTTNSLVSYSIDNTYKYIGTTASRPLNVKTGHKYFDTDLNKEIIYNGTNGWIDTYGFKANKSKGTTSERPTDLYLSGSGFEYYDTDLKKKILWNGEKWVNLDGTIL